MDVVGLRLTRAEPRSDTSAVAAHPLHRIANNGDDVQNDASKNPRRFANCSKIRAKRKGEPVPRVARLNEQRASSSPSSSIERKRRSRFERAIHRAFSRPLVARDRGGLAKRFVTARRPSGSTR